MEPSDPVADVPPEFLLCREELGAQLPQPGVRGLIAIDSLSAIIGEFPINVVLHFGRRTREIDRGKRIEHPGIQRNAGPERVEPLQVAPGGGTHASIGVQLPDDVHLPFRVRLLDEQAVVQAQRVLRGSLAGDRQKVLEQLLHANEARLDDPLQRRLVRHALIKGRAIRRRGDDRPLLGNGRERRNGTGRENGASAVDTHRDLTSYPPQHRRLRNRTRAKERMTFAAGGK